MFGAVHAALAQAPQACRVISNGRQIELHSPAFAMRLELGADLHAVSWENRLTGRKIALGNGPELDVDIDLAEQRIAIGGWKFTHSQRTASPPDADLGFERGFASPDFDDSGWEGVLSATKGLEDTAGYSWARTKVSLPAAAEGKPLFLTLGGFGLFDHRYMRVFLNGHEIGTRQTQQRWNEPRQFAFMPGSAPYRSLRFGQDNTIALQLSEFVTRPARLDELDPRKGKSIPGSVTWPHLPAQFEQFISVGRPSQALEWKAARLASQKEGAAGEAIFELTAQAQGITARVMYQWDARQPVLRKFVKIDNSSRQDLRLLKVQLGRYRTSTAVTEGEQGFPVYLGTEFFMSVAHPSGWAIGQAREVWLRQFPGTSVTPGKSFQCMEAVYGVAAAGLARKTFLAHLRGRLRRVVYGHDKAYSIFEPFGGKPDGHFEQDENYILDNLTKVTQGVRDEGCKFDIHCLEFWVDYRGDLVRFDPRRFPNGPTHINRELKKIGMAPGLWIDSSMEAWTIGGNPAVKSTLTGDLKYIGGVGSARSLCRAAEPIKSMYSKAFRYHIREEGVRLLKFDNLRSVCYNPSHGHLPGVYSTEAIHNGVIGTLQDLSAENPDVFLMLYWGHRSPWWLLHADTLFEPGLAIEAASPGPSPAPHARDGVIVGLDQAQWYCEDVPPLGKDSLGVWLSDWPWNSSIGKERWQEALVMDMGRGSLLAQVWSDTAWLSPAERKQLAEFIALMKERPACFGNARFVLGNPWRHEPYGYCCSDGTRSFFALNNCTWSDTVVKLELNSAWGLPDQQKWDLYRWHPAPAQLVGEPPAFSQTVSLALRPFEIVLLEAVPSGQSPSLNRHFDRQPISAEFTEASRPIAVSVESAVEGTGSVLSAPWIILTPTSATSAGGATLTQQADHSILASGSNPSPESYRVTARTDLTGITAIRLEVLPDPSLPAEGPGRAANGNFALSELRLTAAPAGDPAQARRVVLRNAVADFSQTTHGGWPVTAAIDANPATAWSIDPEEGWPHAASFETAEPIGFTGGTTFMFVLDQQPHKEHNIGRLRLSVSTAKPPVPLGAMFVKPRLVVTGQSPATATGGALVVIAEMHRGAAPFMIGDAAGRFSVQGWLAGQNIAWEPAVRGPSYPVSWQAWRIALKPSTTPQPFELHVTAKTPAEVKLTFQGRFIAAGQRSIITK